MCVHVYGPLCGTKCTLEMAPVTLLMNMNYYSYLSIMNSLEQRQMTKGPKLYP